MKTRGFTIVEIVITITILGILLTLAVVNLTSSQISARDNERKSDIETIAIYLEAYYTNKLDNGTDPIGGNTYLGTADLNDAALKANIPNLDPKTLRAPGVAESDPISLKPALNAVQTTAGVSPQPTNSEYIYQPLTTADTICSDPIALLPNDSCRKFNLYYRLETDNSVQMLTSRNQ